MQIRVEKRDLFRVDDSYALAHCISLDCKMGAGIAVEFQKKFGMRQTLLRCINGNEIDEPITIFTNEKVFNLITKKRYWQKPTYDTLGITLVQMRDYMINNNMKKLATYKLGCCRDKLQWGRVRELIMQVFQDTDIEILICHQ